MTQIENFRKGDYYTRRGKANEELKAHLMAAMKTGNKLNKDHVLMSIAYKWDVSEKALNKYLIFLLVDQPKYGAWIE
jgi:hypothetical protein